MLNVVYTFPSNQQFNELFCSVGWGDREDEKINTHRQSSCFAVCVFEEEKIIGMARVVGDGAYYTVYDVVARKEYQGKGVGTMLRDEVVRW